MDILLSQAPHYRRLFRFSASLLAAALAAVAVVHAAEPWADPDLSVTNGLQLWLDASRQIQVRQKQGHRWLSEGAPVDRWFDGSGHRRHPFQLVRESMPRFLTAHGVAWMRFDGKDDSLSVSGLNLQPADLTLFLVAAPSSNEGWFRGMLALAETARNDYVRGLNIDLGPQASTRFDFLNVESAGAGGARNLLSEPSGWNRLRILTVVAAQGTNGIRVLVDGEDSGARDRAPSIIKMDEVHIGARFYSNTDDPAHLQGFFEGDIAEVLLYDRALERTEVDRVLDYLTKKYAALKDAREKGDETFNPLVAVGRPPPVQMFVPGFEARELPIELPNLNGIQYREDGKLVALGYNGHIHILSDTDGDGLEDYAVPFWETNSLRAPVGMALTPPGYRLGRGVFVAAKGKVALILDTDGDDHGDREIVVADGWRELPHGVDALGVAIDSEQNVYFGLGTTDFTNPYLIDRNTGRARYSLANERGAILKVSPDFKTREIICTGIRFPVGLAFNSQGDLFCTDQEGATWLPNGNPFDELLHIQPGRHYGFPPRHPVHLPDVIDEPSTFDYRPQHQSTCGLRFNEPVFGGPAFGPEWWKGDALVTGYSRGKLYRTKLIKTPSGYAAQNQLIAALDMMPVDVSVSPRGDLVVAAHSGRPDWGSGPNGTGKVYKIRYVEPDLPQPALVWAATPTETHISWDRPLTPEQARLILRHAAAAGGSHLDAGSRFESLRPGYQVVQDQLRGPRFLLPIHSAQLSADRCALVLRTERRSRALSYAITLGLPRESDTPDHPDRAGTARPGKPLPQHAAIDLAYSLHGIEVSWMGSDPAGTNAWTGWIPSLDLAVSRALVRPSLAHEGFRKALRTDGSLTLRTRLDLWQMLRPAVQPGSKIDYTWPEERVFIRLRSGREFTVVSDGKRHSSQAGSDRRQEIILEHRPEADRWLPVEVTLPTGGSGSDSDLLVDWYTAEDPRERPLALHRMWMPWAAPAGTSDSEPEAPPPPQIARADWLEGRKLFFGETAGCYRCHTIRGQGIAVGPDLSNLVHRDYASVLKDILEPNAALNPDHLAYEIELEDGEPLSGVLRQETPEELVVAMAGLAPLRVPKSTVKAVKPASLSLMPEGLGQALGEQDLNNLMAFLLTAPVEPAPLSTRDAPPPRPRREVEELMAHVSPPNGPLPDRPFRILLVAGPKDHGPDEHDYPLWQKRWEKLLGLAKKVKVSTASGWPSAEQMESADVMVFYSNNPGWSQARAEELARFQERGGGLVYLHFAVDGHKDVEALSRRIGLAWRGGHSKFRHGPLDLTFDLAHPCTKGMTRLDFHDESYWNLVGDPAEIQVLATGVEEGEPRPLIWTREHDRGRVFVSILGHYTWTFDDPAFRLLILRGICWAGHQPVDRLSELACVGARIGE